MAAHSLLVVIHAISIDQACHQAEVAFNNGADGIFLINHQSSSYFLFKCYKAVRARYPTQWIGLNFLDVSALNAMEQIPLSANGLWTDNAMIDETGRDNGIAARIRQVQHDRGWHGLYFGGVAFKYQRNVADLEAVTKLACQYMDIVTTSGSGTGIAADVTKIHRMASVLTNNASLAIASGITPENVQTYPDARYFLVATSISDAFDRLNPDRVRLMAMAIAKMNAPS